MFGIGWGLAGICPGPFYAMAPMNNLKVTVYWGIPYIVGLRFGSFVEFLLDKLRTLIGNKSQIDVA